MDLKEEPLSDEDYFDEVCEHSFLSEELLRSKQEEIWKIEQEIEKVKNVHLNYIAVRSDTNYLNSKDPHLIKTCNGQICFEGNNHSAKTENHLPLLPVQAKTNSNSIDMNHNESKLKFDEMPVRKIPCMNFQEHLENVLKEDKNVFKGNGELMQATKQTFLKRGQGLKRYKNTKSQDEIKTRYEKTISQSSGSKALRSLSIHQSSAQSTNQESVPKTQFLSSKKLVTKHPQTFQRETSHLNKSISNIGNVSPSPKTGSSERVDKHVTCGTKDASSSINIRNSDIRSKSRDQNFGPDETQPLNEFEILEGYANEDASFLSSVSTVDRVLQQHYVMSVKDKTIDDGMLKSLPLSMLNKATVKINCSKTSSESSNHIGNSVCPSKKVLQNTDSKSLDNLVVLDVKRTISTINTRNSLEEKSLNTQFKFNNESKDAEVAGDCGLTIHRGNYVPSLYAGFSNDDTFSTDVGWTKEYAEGDFEDDMSWNDITLIENKPSRNDHTKKPVNTKPPVASILNNQFKPTLSNLVSNVFPGSGCSNLVESIPHQSVQMNTICQGSVGDSRLVQKKVLELDAEIERYKKDSAVLLQMKNEYLSCVASFKKEVEEFKKKKLTEMEEFNAFKNEEMQKLKKEKKTFDMYKKSHQDLFCAREDRKIQDTLKNELEKFKEETASKEQRWKANSERMKDRNEQLLKENLDLKGRLFTKEQELKMKIQDPQVLKKKSLDRYSLEMDRGNKISSIPNPPCFVESNSDSILPSLERPILTAQQEEIDTNCFWQIPGLNQEDIVRKQNLPDESGKVTYAKVADRVKNPDGSETIIFVDGDIQQNFVDGTKFYTFTKHGIKNYLYPDGLKIFYFPCGQVEKIFADGNKEIVYPNGNLKYIYTDGSKETILEDGTIIKVNIVKELPDGIKVKYFNNNRKIEYPNGTDKLIHKDGSQEIRDPSGRVRMKDPHGNLTFDSLNNH